jgi:nucleotide-binding universal stress UspA family protein
MYRRVLVAYDGSPESKLAVDECRHLTLQPDRMIHLACVLHRPSPHVFADELATPEMFEVDHSGAQADLEHEASRLVERGFAVTTHLLDGEPLEQIAGLCDTLQIDLLILGHKRSRKWALRWWRGRLDALLADRVRCSILLAGETNADRPAEDARSAGAVADR